MITKEHLNYLFSYDPDTGLLIRKVSTSSRARAGDEAGCIDSQGYISVRVDGDTYKVHRLIWIMVYGELSDEVEIDHRNLVRDDNRLHNLRMADCVLNQINTRKKSHNTSGYKGVSYKEANRKWQAQIRENKKCKYLGLFDTPQEASAVYEAECRRLYGEYARI